MNANPNRCLIACASLALAIAAPATVWGQMEPTPTLTPTPTSIENGSSLAHSDKAFLKKAAKAGMKEVTISQAVLPNLSNPQVKEFAQTMVTDHEAANAELMTLAQQKGLEIPAKNETSLSDDWSKKTDDVDRKYMKEMLSDHEDAVKLFEKGSGSSDADVAAFAQKTLPTLQHHLMMAQDLNKTLNP